MNSLYANSSYGNVARLLRGLTIASPFEAPCLSGAIPFAKSFAKTSGLNKEEKPKSPPKITPSPYMVFFKEMVSLISTL
jgi:hypothetical protein